MVISSASALPRVLRRTPERQIRHSPLKPPVQAIYAKGHVILGAGREPQDPLEQLLFPHANLIFRETMEFATTPTDKAEP